MDTFLLLLLEILKKNDRHHQQQQQQVICKGHLFKKKIRISLFDWANHFLFCFRCFQKNKSDHHHQGKRERERERSISFIVPCPDWLSSSSSSSMTINHDRSIDRSFYQHTRKSLYGYLWFGRYLWGTSYSSYFFFLLKKYLCVFHIFLRTRPKEKEKYEKT